MIKANTTTEKLPVKRRSRNSLSTDEILEASLAIIKNEGIENLSMRRIASELNCSVASPYSHFKNQQEIIAELIAIGEKRLTEDLRMARTRHIQPIDQLTAIAHTYWDFATANRELHKLMFNALGSNEQRKIFTYTPTSYRVFLDTLRRGVKTGEIAYSKQKYHAIARTMWAWIYGVIVLELTDTFKLKNAGYDPINEGIYFFRKLLQQDEAN